MVLLAGLLLLNSKCHRATNIRWNLDSNDILQRESFERYLKLLKT